MPSLYQPFPVIGYTPNVHGIGWRTRISHLVFPTASIRRPVGHNRIIIGALIQKCCNHSGIIINRITFGQTDVYSQNIGLIVKLVSTIAFGINGGVYDRLCTFAGPPAIAGFVAGLYTVRSVAEATAFTCFCFTGRAGLILYTINNG